MVVKQRSTSFWGGSRGQKVETCSLRDNTVGEKEERKKGGI